MAGSHGMTMPDTSMDADPVPELAELSWRFDDGAFNRGDLSVVDALVHPSFTNHDPLPGQGTDREALRAYIPELRRAVPDLRCENQLILAQGDLVAHVIVFSGTFRAPLGDMEPTGAPIRIRAHDFQRWKDNKMLERWSVADTQGFPDPSPTASAT